MNPDIILSITAIAVLGILCQWLAWWARMPAILYLLVCGIIIGPLTGWLNPDDLFGHLLFPAVSLSVAVILFEGSLTLKLEEIRGLRAVVRNLITIGAGVTWVVTAFAVHYLIGMDIKLSFLFGAVVIVTGPTVIIPMLRSVRPNAAIANVLRWEGIVIDPLGALLAVLVFDFIILSEAQHPTDSLFYLFGRLVLVGICMGALSAAALGAALRRHVIPEYLRNVATLSLVFAVFTLSDLIEHESGLLAVTIMGMTLANMKDIDIDDILDFKESLSLLLISALFIVLGARSELGQLFIIGLPALGVLLVLMVVARPLGVLLSTLGSDLNWRERALIAWIGPRGIVCAAVAAAFALRLEEKGFTEARLIVPLAFLVIIGTVLIQSLTAKRLAGWLGVREPPPTGVLIVGAGNVARAIAKVLREKEFKVLLTDSSWENTRAARMEGLDTYYGNPISEHAERHLDLTGIGRMLAISGRGDLDALASLRFKTEFGAQGVYELRPSREMVISDKHRIGTRHRGNQLFGEDITYGTIANWLRDGAEIRSTQLSEEFGFEAYRHKYGERILPLFGIDTKSRLRIFTAEKPPQPEPGWTIMSLVRPEAAAA